MPQFPDIVFFNGRITTLDPALPEASAIAVRAGTIVAVGADNEVLLLAREQTRLVDLRGRRVIPGLNDSHTHLIRAGLNYNLELRWDGVGSLADAMTMLREQADRTPPPQWVRVVGGFNEFQFKERRLPTLEEINRASPSTPVFILHLYDRALLNAAALRAVGYTRETPDPPGAEIQRDARGNPTGLLLARPNAMILYATLAKGPRLSADDQVNSTRLYMRELNRLGITSVIDAGGGYQNYPDDYAVVRDLAARGELTVRIAYNLFTQRPGHEREDFEKWATMLRPGEGNDEFRHNGAGEMLVFSAADFEDFREPRPELAENMERQLLDVTHTLLRHRWPFRIHATYDESISRMLDTFERAARDIPFDGLRWILDHAETISERNIDRVAALGGGIAIQHRMAYQGEYFLDRYGPAATASTPPFKRMLEMGVPVGMGTDATRVASYNPWVGLAWLVTGRTVGGTHLYPPHRLLDRAAALRLYTEGSAWFSGDDGRKGVLRVGQMADFAVLTRDYFSIPESEIARLSSVMTVLGGRIVHADEDFGALAPPLPRPSPDWSPVGRHDPVRSAQGAVRTAALHGAACQVHRHRHAFEAPAKLSNGMSDMFWGALGCSCAF